jgi:hypothetical protein
VGDNAEFKELGEDHTFLNVLNHVSFLSVLTPNAKNVM